MNSENTKATKKPLIDKIATFRKWRKWIAMPLIILGVAGLILPILPGLVLIFFGLLLICPDLAFSLKNKIAALIKKFVK